MDRERIKKRIEDLRDVLNKCNHEYYILDDPSFSDLEFDTILKELEYLEGMHPEFFDPNSPTQKVGGDVTKRFKTSKHKTRMYSLENRYTPQDLFDWEKRISKVIDFPISYTCELKYDGVSINLTYKNGNLISAVTRGDGIQGDDVTANVRTIKSLPLKLQGDYMENFEIRGEVILPIEAFKKVNQEREKRGKELYKNPRNTASGSLKLQDSRKVADRHLDCFLYQLVVEGNKIQTQSEALQRLKSMGFKIPKIIELVYSIDEVIDFCHHWEKARWELPYEIDGIVVKVDAILQQEQLGYISKSPRWAIAYKFKTDRISTILKSIDYQVGRTGTIIPVANLEPVLLGGTVVKRASLYNADQMALYDVRIGDVVYVEKGGEIIPKIVGVDFLKRSQGSSRVVFPENCPACDTVLVKYKDDVRYYCPNHYECFKQVSGRIIHFVSRKAMNINGVGNEIVTSFCKNKIIANYADLYDLKLEQMASLGGMAEKSSSNIIREIEASKKIPFERVLYGLGIRFVGETVAKKLARSFRNIDNLFAASFEDLMVVDDIGEKIARSILSFKEDPQHQALILRLKNHGLQFSLPTDQWVNQNDGFSGKIFVISGIFQSVSRNKLKALIEEKNGKVSTAISKKTNYFLAGDNMGKNKSQKVKELKIQIISEEDFFKMLSDLNDQKLL